MNTINTAMLSFSKFVALTEDYINFGDYNLQHKFNHYNQLLFQNQIPECPITWADLKGQAGLTSFSRRGRMYEPGTLKIQISNRFKRSEQDLDSTLIHEMIHAFLITHGHPDENHGFHFQHLAKLCGEKVGIHISISDQLSDMELANDEHVLTTALLWHHSDGKYSAVFYAGNFFDDHEKQNQLKSFWGLPGRIRPGENITVLKVMTDLARKYGKKTEIAQSKWSMISDKEVHDLLQHGQFMFRIEPNSVSHTDALDTLPTKDMLVVFNTNTRTNNVSASFYMPLIARDPAKLQKLFDRWKDYHRMGYNIEIFTTKSINYSRFTAQRDPSKGTYYSLKPDTVAELRRNAHYLAQWIQ
jgi:SprT-like family